MSTPKMNGLHVTAMVCAVCIAIVLAPVAVVAASGARTTTTERVYITDPHHSAYKAAVAASGALSVGGTVTVGNLPATQNVGGTVTANPGSPGTPFTAQSSAAADSTTILVPSGRHLVVQTFSVRIEVTTGDKVNAFLSYTTHGTTGYVFIPLTFAFTASGSDFYVAALPIVIYADPLTSVILEASPAGGTTDHTFLTVSGYLT